MEELYYNELKKEDRKRLSVFNLPKQGLHEFLKKRLETCRLFEPDDLIWQTSATPRYALDKTLSAQDPYQLLTDPGLHKKIREKVFSQMIKKYGENYADIPITNTLQLKIGLYYK